jgi:Asp-tRNA(Asn)/Glu-tRNA(Gln) amidotransferase B subunit
MAKKTSEKKTDSASKATKAAKKVAKKKVAKKKVAKKVTRVEKADGKTVEKSKYTKKQTAFLIFLLAKGALSATTAVNRDLVWENVAGMSVMIFMKKAGLAARVDHEDQTVAYYLTAEGKKEAKICKKNS